MYRPLYRRPWGLSTERFKTLGCKTKGRGHLFQDPFLHLTGSDPVSGWRSGSGPGPMILSGQPGLVPCASWDFTRFSTHRYLHPVEGFASNHDNGPLSFPTSNLSFVSYRWST